MQQHYHVTSPSPPLSSNIFRDNSVTKQQRWTVFALISRVIFWLPSYFLFLFILKKLVLVVTSYAGERSKMYYT